MKVGLLRYGSISIFIIWIFSLLVSCAGELDELGASITLTVGSTSIPADGFSSTTITATIYDNSGSIVPVGTSVTFTTDLGSFPGGITSFTGWTGSGGTVTVSLIAGTTPGIATIICTSSGVTQLIKVSITDAGSGGGTASITLTANPTSIPPDGFSSSVITATLLDSAGNSVSVGTFVTFTTNLGSFPGGTTESGWTSDDTGVVTVSLIAGIAPGIATVTATSNNVSQAVLVTFAAP